MLRRIRLVWQVWRVRRSYKRWARKTADLVYAQVLQREWEESGRPMTPDAVRRAMREAEAQMRAGAENVAREGGIWVGDDHGPPGDVLH
jgi:hypothetical protein